MNLGITKKVRLSRADARRLARLARETSQTESAVLREGLDLVERVRDRRRAAEELIKMVEGQTEPPKVRWSLK